MAESKKNIVIQGLSGKFGDMLVFRQFAGRTFATQAPGARTGEPTEAQKRVRERFQRASIYGRTVVADGAVKKEYGAAAKEGQSAYNVAIADFFNAPDIVEIDVSGYSGQPGQVIRVRVLDDFKVKLVRVTIQNEDGTLQEEGNAVRLENGLDWSYTTTTSNSSISGDKITITATDNPDNLAMEEKTL